MCVNDGCVVFKGFWNCTIDHNTEEPHLQSCVCLGSVNNSIDGSSDINTNE